MAVSSGEEETPLTLGEVVKARDLGTGEVIGIGEDRNADMVITSSREEKTPPIGKSHDLDNYKEIGVIGKGAFGEVVKARDLGTGEVIGIGEDRNADMVISSSGEEETPLTLGFLRDYKIMEQMGNGTFGDVFKALHITTGEIVALKKLKLKMYGVKSPEIVPDRARLEINILRKLDHPNVISFKEVVSSSDESDRGIYLVFECMDGDFAGIAEKGNLTAPEIKDYMKQLLTGLEYCHANQVLHRDVKTPNILVSKKVLKLADFGLSCFMEDVPDPEPDSGAESASDSGSESASDSGSKYNIQAYLEGMTNSVVTLPYKAPELLLGSTNYGPEIDIWSAGCIFGQLLNRGERILLGEDKHDQIEKIYQLCGTPSEESWPGVSTFFYFGLLKKKLTTRYESCLRETFKHVSSDALELLESMLTLDPSKRISARAALESSYFRSEDA